MLTKRQRLRIKREMAGEKPTLWIGKGGVTQEAVEEVKRQLKKNEVVKVKVLKTILEQTSMKVVAKDLVEKTGAELIEVRGHGLVLYKVKIDNNDQSL